MRALGMGDGMGGEGCMHATECEIDLSPDEEYLVMLSVLLLDVQRLCSTRTHQTRTSAKVAQESGGELTAVL